jgi:hypothetical protein
MLEQNTGHSSRLPRLRTSYSEKVKNKFEHTKRVMDYYIMLGTFMDEVINPNIRDPRVFYEAYNNRLPDSFFHYVTNPLNSSNSDYTNWPARLRSYPIIRPNVDLLEGEYERRPFSFAVKVHNADAYNQAQDAMYKDILKSLEQQFINALNASGQDTGVPSEQPQLPEKIKAAYASNYRDKRAEIADTALNIIIDQQQLEEKFKRLFRDWLIAGECFTYKGMRGGRMVYERCSPLDIDYDKSPDSEYIEDGQWCVKRSYMTPSEIQDQFYKELEENEIDLIEDQSGHLSFNGARISNQLALRDDKDLRKSKVVVFHCTWKYLTKIGILTYINPMTGEPEEIEVPENYKVNKEQGETCEWYWVNEVWEGYRLNVGRGEGLFLGIKPVEGQRNTVNNSSLCKLPYNGKRFSDIHSQNVSVVEMGMPYEILHRILHYQMEKTIAKSKGKIILMDQGAIPKKHGWDEEKFFYWADATGWALIDRSQPGVDKSFNQYNVLDMGLYQHIENLISLMTFVKQEWDELLGISRQRKGNVTSSDTATGAQLASNNSSVISEKVFSRFEEFVRCELQGLLDISKLAWSDGFQAVYQGDDLRTQMLSIDPVEYTEMDMGVYISRSARDLANLEMVRQQVQAFAQNGVNPSTIVDVVQAKSLSKLKILLQEMELKSQEQAQAAQQSEQEGQERLVMIENSFEELKGVIEERLLHVKYDREEDLEILKQSGVDQNPEAIIDPSAAQKVISDDQNKKREISLKERAEAVKARQKDRELDLKQHELVVRERIADKNNKAKLKNPVAGERSKSKK